MASYSRKEELTTYKIEKSEKEKEISSLIDEIVAERNKIPYEAPPSLKGYSVFSRAGGICADDTLT